MEKQPLKVKVTAISDEAPGIRAYDIVRVDGLPFDAYEPGAHIDVIAPSGVMRQYSLCSDPGQYDVVRFAVKREEASRGGSRSLHDDVQAGAELAVSLPRNLFRLAPEARQHVLIAAGIGITPLLNMAYRLVAQQTPFVLHYFVRGAEHAAFRQVLSAPPFAAHVRWHAGIEPAQLDEALTACCAAVEAGAHLYTCGPAPFMDRVVAVGERYVPPEAIHLERFSAGPAATEPEAASAGGADSFEVEVASTGQVIRIEPGVSIVTALAGIGIEIDTSCGEGVCGTCMVDVTAGEPEHRDHCLSKAERASNKVICCCVSRSRSPRLVLDL